MVDHRFVSCAFFWLANKYGGCKLSGATVTTVIIFVENVKRVYLDGMGQYMSVMGANLCMGIVVFEFSPSHQTAKGFMQCIPNSQD